MPLGLRMYSAGMERKPSSQPKLREDQANSNARVCLALLDQIVPVDKVMFQQVGRRALKQVSNRVQPSISLYFRLPLLGCPGARYFDQINLCAPNRTGQALDGFGS
jgi:hypothetical protein